MSARGMTCSRHTRRFNEGRQGSLKLVARGEEACSAGPAASAALLAGVPVQCLRYERSRPCQSNHSLQPFLFGYNKMSFSIHILQVKSMDKL